MVPRRLLPLAVLLAASVLALPAQGALAADPGAPHGAPANWLPAAEWVQERWLPFDVPDLEQAMGMPLVAIQVRISDHRTLAQLAAGRHLRWRRVLAATMAPRRAHVGAARFRELTAHARWIFTRGHLATHMLFHGFHYAAINRVLLGYLGLPSWSAYEQLQVRGFSIARMGRRHGVAPAVLTRKIIGVMRRQARIGVGRHLESRAQALRFFAASSAGVRAWIGWNPRAVRASATRFTEARRFLLCHRT